MEHQTETVISGEVSAVVYAGKRTGYGVIRVRGGSEDEITVVGYLPDPAPGERIEARGAWTTHPQYGPQFKADAIVRTLPAEASAILDYLSARVVPGIGAATAARLVARFGAETLTILGTAPERLSEVSGITPRRAAAIGEAFAKQHGVRRLMEFLSGYGLPLHLATRLAEHYGAAAVEAVRADPYLLVSEPFAVSFSKADELALALHFDGDDPRRVRAAVRFELMFNAEEGHVFLPEIKLIESTVRFIGVDAGTAYEALEALAVEGAVIRTAVGRIDACYLAELREAEVTVARQVAARCTPLPPPGDLDALIDAVQAAAGVDYAKAQREALCLAAQSRVMLLTGGPGTGKTTTLRAMLDLFDRLGLSCALAAPTGRAAKRMSEVTGREARTLHRLLEIGFNPETGRQGFVHDAAAPLRTDVVVIDEMSMVDTLLMRALVEALPEKGRLVMVGDPDQLPSVGPGLVLSDLLASGRVPSVRLTEIFRQAGQSQIVRRAHEVNRGALSPLRGARGKDEDFFFLSRCAPEDALVTILDLCARRLPQNLGLAPAMLQVISPTRRGVTGTVNLNRHLQEALNPPSPERPEHRFGAQIFRVGDRIMQIKNNYDLVWKQVEGPGGGLGVFNGDTGVVVALDVRAERLTVRFDDDRLAVYPFDRLGELEPAWAVTVHKAQGSEYPAVILAALPGPPMLMNRRVLYTAVTRARRWLIAVGSEDTLRAMAQNHRETHRYTGLTEQLIIDCGE
ncbi:MAG: ATP-dependent RecD-like DNA helicase [Oscillospiraceae bacterium]|jgi:exodeoxyribonuclease V alpha subunit|nr:ATP-dependent RecD-like DNA helicase [Oscillospiraceae bacterium]